MKKNLIKILIPFFTILVMIYLCGIIFYENRYLPNTYINEINIANKTEETVKKELLENINNISISLIAEDVSEEVIFGDEIGYKTTISENFNTIQSNQNKYIWFLNFIVSDRHTIELESTYDKDLLKERLKNTKCIKNENQKEAINAYVKKDKSGFRIIKEEDGTIVDLDKLYNECINCIENKKTTINLRKDKIYKEAEIKMDSPELLQELEYYKQISDFTIVYDFADRQEIIDFKIYGDWISLSENKELIIDEEKISEYVNSLASKYNTLGTTIPFKTTNLGIKELKCEQYGWKINKSETITQLKEALYNKENITLEPVYTKKAISREENFIGNTYIEVSIDEQMMWLYKEGECIVETPVVTGLPTQARATTPGIYSLVSRETDRYLGTLEVQGYSSYVNFWMPFNGGQGIHDATWRTDSEFGGNTYKTNGSHGCVNTPLEAVEKIYNNIKTGYAVIVH